MRWQWITECHSQKAGDKAGPRGCPHPKRMTAIPQTCNDLERYGEIQNSVTCLDNRPFISNSFFNIRVELGAIFRIYGSFYAVLQLCCYFSVGHFIKNRLVHKTHKCIPLASGLQPVYKPAVVTNGSRKRIREFVRSFISSIVNTYRHVPAGGEPCWP